MKKFIYNGSFEHHDLVLALWRDVSGFYTTVFHDAGAMNSPDVVERIQYISRGNLTEPVSVYVYRDGVTDPTRAYVSYSAGDDVDPLVIRRLERRKPRSSGVLSLSVGAQEQWTQTHVDEAGDDYMHTQTDDPTSFIETLKQMKDR